MTVADPGACAECGAPLAADQRYCLACGARAGARPPGLQALLASAGARATPRPRVPAAPAGARARLGSAWRSALVLPEWQLPPRPVSAMLLAAFLGFGALIGSAAGDRRGSVSGTPLRLVLPRAQTAASAPGAGGAAARSSEPAASGEAPPTEAEPTPAPAASAHAPATTRTPAPGEAAPAAPPPPSGEGGSGGEAQPARKLPAIRHVFLITLSDEPYASVFGPTSTAGYLARTLERRGELLVRYDAVAHEALANRIALISGQGPTPQTAADCPTYTDLVPATPAAAGQVLGTGCVFPRSVRTIAGQLASRHLTWRAYVQGADEPGATAGPCAHPAPGAADPSAQAGASTGPLATFEDPFVYFHAVIDSPSCARQVVGLASLKRDLATTARTPSLSYITPDRCHDASPVPCVPGAAAGLIPADEFLARVVPQILASPAYRSNGLLVITVDEAPSSGEYGDSSSCCGQPRFPNAPQAPGALAPRGGGQVGALLLSRWVKGGATAQEEFNHFSLLRTIEDLFSLPHLGYAGLPAVKALTPSLFTASSR